MKNLVAKTVSRFGKLDIAVNNAASEGQVGPITAQTAETVAATFDTNVVGVLLSMKHEILAMQANSGKTKGNIINISSIYGHKGAAFASVYVAAKHAVEGITKSAALELASDGIRVNCVSPGPTDTGMLTRFTGTDDNKARLVAEVPGLNPKRVAGPGLTEYSPGGESLWNNLGVEDAGGSVSLFSLASSLAPRGMP